MPKYFIYARKSTEDEERQQLSIPAQIDELRTFAKKENLKVIDTFIESKTAKKPGRKLFNQMLRKIEEGGANGIICWHPDRLARNAVDSGQVLHLLDTKKLIDLKFPTLQFQNNAQGLFMLSISFGQSKYFVDNLSENTKRGLRQKIKQGGYPSQAPLGYLNDRLNKTIEVDKVKAPIVVKAFKLYSTGQYSLEAISAFFAKYKLFSKTGKHFHKNRIKHLLTNPFYYGHFRYNGEIYQGKHKPLLTKKFFDQVQEVIKKRGHVQPKIPHNLPFAGFMKCEFCGMTITGETKTKYYKGTNRTTKYTYYRCTRKSKKVSCHQPFIRQKDLLPRINQLIKKHSLPESWGAKFHRKINDEEQKISTQLKKVSQALKLQLKEVKKRLDNLLDSYLDKVITRDPYLDKKNTLMGQKKDLEERLTKLYSSETAWLEPFRNWVDLALQASKVASPNTDLYQKRAFLLNTGSNFYLNDKNAYFPSRKPWALLCSAATSRSLEPGARVELATYCLRHNCSTN